MHYLRGGSGVPFVLVHGIPGSTASWEKVGSQLTQSHDVVIPDLMGFGQSDMPIADYYMEQQAGAIKTLLDDLGIRSIYLGGHDFGGPVAVTFMRLFPEFKIQGLVLSATNMFTDTYVPAPMKLAYIPFVGEIFYKLLAGTQFGLQMMYRQAFINKEAKSLEVFAKEHFTSSTINLTYKILHRSIANLEKNYQPVQDMLQCIQVPTLVLWGDSDPFFATENAERIHYAIKRSKVNIYKRTGHFVPEEKSKQVAEDILNYFFPGVPAGS